MLEYHGKRFAKIAGARVRVSSLFSFWKWKRVNVDDGECKRLGTKWVENWL